MKTNLFKVKSKKEKRIIIEEETTRNSFLLFFKRHKNFIVMSGITLALCLILISTGIAFSLFRGSNDYDITYIEGDEVIDSNNDPEIDDDDVEDELLGELARENGIVFQTKTFMTKDGAVISYFTDGTSVVVNPNGKIYRISTNKDGKHGINEKGEIDSTATKIRVTSTTTTLMDGTVITYYSDGTAKVEYKLQTYFVRDSNNIKINNGSSLDNLAPSNVAPTKDTTKLSGATTLKTFTDGTSLVTINGSKYIVNKNSEVKIEGDNLSYSSSNSFAVISEKTYKDENTITHFSNGSAIITDKNGNTTYVKRSGDILLNQQELYEILPNEKGYSRTTFNIKGNKKVTYFDNGAAIIIYSDGTRKYVEDSDDIIYDNNKSIHGTPPMSNLVSEKVTTEGEKVYNFDNGKSQVITKTGDSYIIDTDKLTFGKEEDEGDEGEDSGSGGGNPNPGEGIYISEAENVYNDFKNIENTKFIIKNNNKNSKNLRITIEETDNYSKYNTNRLPPQYVKFQATVGDYYIPATTLTKNTWKDEEGKTNYIIFEGTINSKETVQVAISLYVNYEPLDNSYQNTGFIGTIRIYVDDEVN